MKKTLLISAIAIGIAVLAIFIVTKRLGEKKGYSPMNEAAVEQLADGMYAVVETEKGNVILELFYDKTPITVANFVALAEGKAGQDQKKGPFYDNLSFHRVVDGFVIQGGDPKGNGTGGPGYQFGDEIVQELVFNKSGLLAMANAGPGTNGSQFFITLDPTPHLNGRHTIFGQVVSEDDMQVVRGIAQGDKMKRVSIVRKGAAAEAFVADRQMHADKVLESKIAQTVPNAQKSSTGIQYVIQKPGSGNKPKKGDSVDVHYKGWLLTSGQVFDSSYERGEPISFKAGGAQVIPGWDEMILDMQLGEKRIVVLPPDQAYGAQGAGGVIPPHAWLVFEMERLK